MVYYNHNILGGISLEPIGVQLLVSLIFLFISFVFSLADGAIISLKSENIESEIKNGNYSYILIRKLLSKPDLFNYTVNFAHLLCLLVACIIFHNNIIQLFVNIDNTFLNFLCRFMILFVFFFLSVILTIYIPRHIAIKHNKNLISFLSLFVYMFYIILLPISNLIRIISNVLDHTFNLSKAENESFTEEEIRMMMDISAEKGAIQNEEREMIDNIFEFNNITAEDIMTHRTDVVAIDIDDNNDDIIETISSSGFSRFPVYDGEIDNIIGILSSRKFLLNLHSYPQKPIKEILYKPYIVPVTIQADLLFKKMQKSKNHIALTVDEYGGFNGIVTMEDLLEEIVGNIYDENDIQIESDIVRLNKNLWKVIGSAELEAINSALSVDIPLSEDYDTLNGLVIDALSYIPEDGAKFAIDTNGLHIQVVSFKDKRITSALISKINYNKN